MREASGRRLVGPDKLPTAKREVPKRGRNAWEAAMRQATKRATFAWDLLCGCLLSVRQLCERLACGFGRIGQECPGSVWREKVIVGVECSGGVFENLDEGR